MQENDNQANNSQGGNKTILIAAVLVLALLLVGGFVFLSQRGGQELTEETQMRNDSMQNSSQSESMTEEGMMEDESMEESMDDEMMEEDVVEVAVEGFEYGYTPATITVKEGQTVRITLENTGSVMHDLNIDEFNAATEMLSPGSSESIEFVADQTGSFEFYCSVGNHRALGMVGTLVVN